MAILKRYKILIITLAIIGLGFYLYNIWLMDKALDDIVTGLLKHAEYSKYIFDVKYEKVGFEGLTKYFYYDILNMEGRRKND